MRENFEASYLRHLEQRGLTDEQIQKRSKEAEEAVMRFFDENFEGMRVRFATKEEDEGFKASKQIIDLVVYRNEKPILGVQVTTAVERSVREKKLREMLDKPFIRLDEMKPSDSAIPRVLVYIPRTEMDTFLQDPDLSHHPTIVKSIFESIENSLKFHRLRNQNPKEIKFLDNALVLFETKRNQMQQYKNRQA